MTREEQLQAVAQIDVVAKRRAEIENRIGHLIDDLRLELEGAIETEQALRRNPFCPDSKTCDHNLEELRYAYDRVCDLFVDIVRGDEEPDVDLSVEGY